MKRTRRAGLFVLCGLILGWVTRSPVQAAVDLTGPFIVTLDAPNVSMAWDIVQSGTSMTVSFSGGSTFASGTIDPDTGAFNLVDSNPFCDPGAPGSLAGIASDSDHFNASWTSGQHVTPTICQLYTFFVTGMRNFCGNGVVDASEQCDGGQCCATDCRFAANGLACDDGNSATTNDQCVDGACGQLINHDIAINTYTIGTQARSRVAGASDGSVVVVWDSFGQDGQANGVYGQRFDSAGGRVGTEFRANSFTTGSQYYSTVATSTSGFLVVWQSENQDGSSRGVFARRYGSNGVPSGTEFQVNAYTTSAQQWAGVAMDATGNALVAWSDFGQGGIFARRFDSSGAAVGTEFLVNDTTTQSERYAEVAAIGDNSFVIVWNSVGGTEGIRGRLCDPTGPVGTDFVVTPSNVYFQARPALAADPIDGDFLVTWEANVGEGIEILARRYASDGTVLGSAFMVNTDTMGDQEDPAVTAEPDGAFLVAWTSPTDGSSLGVFGQRFASDGTPIGTEFSIPSFGVGGQYDAAAAPTGDGRSFVTWVDQNGRDGNGFGVFARLLPDLPSPTGTPATATPTIPTPTRTATPTFPTRTPTPTSSTSTPTPGISRFKCYSGKDLNIPPFSAASVNTTDQLSDEAIQVKNLKYLCVAEGSGNTGVLSCYTANGSDFVPQPTVEVSTQFQTSRFALRKPKLLCVPSTLSMLP